MIQRVPNKYMPATGRVCDIRFDTDALREKATDELLAQHSHMSIRPAVLLTLLDAAEKTYAQNK